jgi:lipoyl(octanoyl) transferase
MKQEVFFKDLGLRHFKEVWDLQEVLLKQNVEAKRILANAKTEQEIDLYKDQIVNHLLFVEHYPVYTLGKNGKPEHILISDEDREKKGVEYFHINRGGDITFHGPGQLVGYPILDLDKFKPDLGWYLRCLEEVIILTLEDYGIDGDRSPGETGVWLDVDNPAKARKICAMGIRCSRWITMHGFALNVNTNLQYFENIIPCGIAHKKVTSIQQELGTSVPMYDLKERVKRNFEIVFNAYLV